MRWKTLDQSLAGNSPWTIIMIFFVFLACAATVVFPAGAANTTQTVSPTQTTVTATSVITTTIPSTTQTTSTVTSATTINVSGTQTTIPVTSQITTVITTGTQSQVTPIVAFSGDTTDGPAPLTVQFTDMSTGGPVSWSWDFGDGMSDTSQNPSHEYSEAGTYTVSMIATFRTGSASAIREDYIEVGPSPTVTATATSTTTTVSSSSNLLAAFNGSPRSGIGPLTVVFVDTTVGTPVTWLWDFGDGMSDTSQNPVHTYQESGTYTVYLTVNSSGAGKTIKQANFITVRSPVDSTQTERTLPGSSSNEYQVKTKTSPVAVPDEGSGQFNTGKTKTPTPTLTGKAWLEYKKQQMAEVDAIAAAQQKKDIFSQIVDFFKGLFPWAK